MTKEFSKKAKSEVRPALFGTDFHGKECWFCWRVGFGCRGIIGAPVKSKFGDVREGVLVLAPSWVELANGNYGRQTRAAFRTVRIRSNKKWINRISHRVMQNPKSEKLKQNLVEDYNAQREKAIELSKRGEQSNKRGFIWQSCLPKIVHCPACGQHNLVPSLRGPIAVKNGSVLK
jgi:hypothetical protein